MRNIWVFLICLAAGISSYAQKYPLVTYSTEQGLPQSQVTSFAQDDKGYLWIGTLGGLARYGGQNFLTYSSNDGLLNNRISYLTFFDHTLWIGHDGGISVMRNGEFESIEFQGNGNDRSRKVSSILKFKGEVFVCSIGGGLFKLKGKQLHSIQLDQDEFEFIRDAYQTAGRFYIATKKGILVSTDGLKFTVEHEFGDFSFSGVSGNGDVLIASSFGDGCFQKNLRTGELKVYGAQELRHKIQGCLYDGEQRIWLSTNHGVVQIDKKGELHFYDESNGLPVNSISTFFYDNTGNIWIGSSGKGMFRFPSADFKFYDQTTGFPSDLYVGGFQDEDGYYYFSTYDKGVFKWKPGSDIITVILSDSPIWASLEGVDGKNWFGGEHMLVDIDKAGRVRTQISTDDERFPGWKLTALYKINANSMYIGGNGGVSIYKNGEIKPLGKTKDRNIGTVRDFEVYKNKLYCVTNLGLYVYQNEEFEIAYGIDDLAYNIEKDDFGSLWFGTEEGLFRIRNEKVEKIDLLPDPGSNFIDLMNAKGKQLYVGTNNGLFVLSEIDSDTPKVERFGVQEGVLDLETNLNSGFFDHGGDFWFGTASGLVCYRPSSIAKSGAKPIVNLVQILLNYEPFEYSKFASEIGVDGLPKQLILPFSRNNLIFELDGVSLELQRGLNYQFWLEGLNEDWSPLSNSPTITFTSLPAGDYILHARCVNMEGIASDELTFPFIVRSPIYMRWWFMLLVAILISGLVFLIFRIRIQRIESANQQEMLEYKTRLLSLEQQSMNASMNRHFIFNALNSIQYFINTQDRSSANKYLTNFAKLIRKNLDSATGGNQVSLDEELERLELYLSLESMRFKDRFKYEINLHDVDAESILIPPMLMQPFIENSIIHGILPNEDKVGLITIDVSRKGDYIYIRIEDNGIGIRKSISQKYSMEGDHRSQGMEITSKRIELIQKISNNDISLEGPEELIDDNGKINGTYVLIKIPTSDLEI